METISNFCVFLVIASIIATPVLLLISLIKAIRKKPAKKMLKYALISVCCVFVFSVVGAMTAPSDEQDGGTGGQSVEAGTEDSTEEPVFEKAVPGLTEVLKSVGINPVDAEAMEKIDDWANGPRYSFPTHGTTARVYCNMDGSIESVRVGTDIDLYKKGYEPWSIENFLIDDGLKPNLMTCAEDAVTACLNYPETADFPLLDWSFGREFDRYYVNSSVEAQNAFGVPSEMEFSAVFAVEDESIRLIGLQLDGQVLVDALDDYPLPERDATETQDEIGSDGGIRLVDEQLGKYGEKVKLDSSEYIWYHVPEGTYDATCQSKQCTIYVDKNNITRNSSGYVEMETVQTVELSYGETKEVIVGPGEHIFLTIYADVTLVQK